VVANVGDIVLGENPSKIAEVFRGARRYARTLTLSLTIIALIKLIALAGASQGPYHYTWCYSQEMMGQH
jgi:hypothetical protein